MDEKNPLHVTLSPPRTVGNIANKRGRPTTEKMVKFGPQPMSIVAQMLQKLKTENLAVPTEPSTDTTGYLTDDEKIDQTEDFVCKVCCQRSATTKEHEKHIKTHRQYSCDFPDCSYSCKQSSNLIKHKRVHTDERPYLCELCSFRSNFINSLKAHKRIHTSERPYHCKYCRYKCNSSSNLKKHCLHRHPDAPK